MVRGRVVVHGEVEGEQIGYHRQAKDGRLAPRHLDHVQAKDGGSGRLQPRLGECRLAVRVVDTFAAGNALVEHGNAATERADTAVMEIAGLKEQLTAAEAKAVRLEQELYGANAKMEAQREQLAAVRASREAHAATLQSKQFDRGKDVRVNS